MLSIHLHVSFVKIHMLVFCPVFTLHKEFFWCRFLVFLHILNINHYIRHMKVRSLRLPDSVNKDRLWQTNVFMSLPSLWLAFGSSKYCFFFLDVAKTEHFQNYFRKWQEWSVCSKRSICRRLWCMAVCHINKCLKDDSHHFEHFLPRGRFVSWISSTYPLENFNFKQF